MLNIALTGNVASGKSTVAELFRRWGAVIIDADQIVREVQAPGTPVLAAIARRFGKDILKPDGSLERAQLRAHVLADPEALKDLNAIVHPAVHRLRTKRVAEAKAAYDAEMTAWPTIATPIAAAMNAIKGEANIVDRRRNWGSPLEASLFGNSVSRATFDAMQSAITASLPDFRRWMRSKARLHGYDGGLRWWDLIAPLPQAASETSWDAGIEWVRSAFASYSDELAGLVDRALEQQWIDAGPRDGKAGGAAPLAFDHPDSGEVSQSRTNCLS